MSNKLLFRLAVLVTAMMCALGASAQEAYAVYTSDNTTLTFYYDNQRSSRPGTTYDIPTTADIGWFQDGSYANVTQVVFDPSFASVRPTKTYAWFRNMENLQTITGMSYLNTSAVTTMYMMFRNCSSLTTLDLSPFNTANVTNMQGMFMGCSNLQTIYVGEQWSTDAVTSSTFMFSNCTSLMGGRGTAYNDSNPKDKTYAHIDGGTSNPGYFTEKGPDAYACYTSSNTTLTFYYDKLRFSRSGMTYDLNTDINAPGWFQDGSYANVTKVVFDPSFTDARPKTTYGWFYNMQYLESITGMEYLIASAATNMDYMFAGCTMLTSIDLSHFYTYNVTSMIGMFAFCDELTILDLSNLDTSKVTDMSLMFLNCHSLQTIYVSIGWSTAAVTNSLSMFKDCTNLVGGQGTTYAASHVGATYAHIDGGTSNPGYFTAKTEGYACYTPDNTTLSFYYDNQRSSRTGTTYNLNTENYSPAWNRDAVTRNVTRVVFSPSFANARPTSTRNWFEGMGKLESITGMKEYLNTSEVIRMDYMFHSCFKLTSLDLSSFNTSKVTNMQYMFRYCTALTSIDVSHFNTSKVTNMDCMFDNCSALTSLDLSSFNTSKVKYMSSMFFNCYSLQTIYAGDGWNTTTVWAYGSMFKDCTSLVGGQGTTYDASHIDKAYAHIDGGPSNPGYFTAKNAGQRGDVNGDGSVNISDVTALIDYLLSGNASGINLSGADCNQDSSVNISDVTALIDYLLSGTWN